VEQRLNVFRKLTATKVNRAIFRRENETVRNYGQALIAGLLLFLAAGCSADKPSGTVQVMLIHPSGPGCQYSISPAPIDTLSSITKMTGLVGSVVVNSQNLATDPSILDNGAGFNPIDVNFIQSGGTYAPQDLNTLFAVSLYYAVEKGYELFAGLDPTADLAQIVPNFSQTLIVDEARRTFGDVGAKPEVSDNAEYLPHDVQVGGQTVGTRNYFLSYPTSTVTQIPLGLNLGIMVHEFTHMVFHYLFYAPAFAQNEQVSNTKPTAHTLASLDEGLADYFGYLVTGDPSFFECSFPQENRDLGVPKSFTSQIVSDIAGTDNFDAHEGGAIFAAVNYEIGIALGNPQLNGKYLIHFMATLLNCPAAQSGTNTMSLDFAGVAACQAAAADPSAQGIIQQTWAKYLGAYAGGIGQ